ncbi:MAG: S1/P1 nuclease [Thermodesulfovibrionales bacterium]|nr:S1/P1 nuclease [Thermodesulfovibrionales bacterium]
MQNGSFLKKSRIKIFCVFLLIVLNISSVSAWHDETHLAVARAAGYKKWYNAAGADITKIKAGRREQNNHYFNNNDNAEVSPQMVMSQISRYNDPADMEGHLYGAIIASIQEYKKTSQSGKYPEYHIAFCAHYTGDLSQPLHNTLYDDFNKTHHGANDGTVENEVLKNISLIEKNMYPIILRQDNFEEGLAREISRIANISRMLGIKLRTENRNMTKEEAYTQLGHSASLLRAILKYPWKD